MDLRELATQVGDAQAMLEDAAGSLRRYAENQIADPERLAVLMGEADRQLAALPEPAAQAVRAQLRALSSLPPPVWGGLDSARFLQGDR